MSRLKNEINRAAVSPVEVDEEGWVSRIYRFPSGFIGFSGHFPGFPILPAIVQVLTAQLLAETRLPEGMRPGGVRNAKFLLQLRPDQDITVQSRLQPKGKETQVEARILCEQGLAASFTLIFSSERPSS